MTITNETPTKITDSTSYINSLRGRDLTIYLFGEKVKNYVEHPMIRPSINAIAETYELAVHAPELASVISPFTGEPISRFLNICTECQTIGFAE